MEDTMFSKKLVKKLKAQVSLDGLCKSLDVLGAGCLVLAILVAFGVAPALAATGVALIAIGYQLE